jgi:hypothetical protein
MANLLTDPPVTPTRDRRLSSHKLGTTLTPKQQLHSAGQVDLEEQTSGWDWDALSDYVPTPKKPRDPPRKALGADSKHQVSTVPVASKYTPDPCTRCLAQTVTDRWDDGVREKVRMLLRILPKLKEIHHLAHPGHNRARARTSGHNIEGRLGVHEHSQRFD